MQSVDEELQAAREEKAGLHERVTEARRMLTMSKEKLRSRSSVHRVLINERVAFEEKAQKKRLENVRRGHTVQSTRNDVAWYQYYACAAPGHGMSHGPRRKARGALLTLRGCA